jgi:hypothetical protein
VSVSDKRTSLLQSYGGEKFYKIDPNIDDSHFGTSPFTFLLGLSWFRQTLRSHLMHGSLREIVKQVRERESGHAPGG